MQQSSFWAPATRHSLLAIIHGGWEPHFEGTLVPHVASDDEGEDGSRKVWKEEADDQATHVLLLETEVAKHVPLKKENEQK